MQFDPNRTNMLREIKEQPQVLYKTINSVASQVAAARQLFDAKWNRSISSLFLIGCGTSYHAAIATKHALRALAGISSTAYQASEFRDFEIAKRGDILIALSQSGETGDLLTAVKMAAKNGCIVVAITNEARSTLAEISELAVKTEAGKELAIPMTKTYTALLAASFSLALELGPKKRDASPLRQIPKTVEDTIRASEPIVRRIADELKALESIFIVGRGPNYATALEASLKLKEAALLHAEAFPSSEFRHGPKAMLEPRIPLIAFTHSDKLDDTTARLLDDVRPTGARITSIGDRSGSTIQIPPVDYYLSPIPAIVPLQLLATYTAVAKGLDPDNPRGLAKITAET